MERRIFVCDCYSLEHQVAFWYDEEENSLYIEPRLATHENFFKRIVSGVKFIFGYKTRFGEWDEIILSDESAKSLLDFLTKKFKK